MPAGTCPCRRHISATVFVSYLAAGNPRPTCRKSAALKRMAAARLTRVSGLSWRRRRGSARAHLYACASSALMVTICATRTASSSGMQIGTTCGQRYGLGFTG